MKCRFYGDQPSRRNILFRLIMIFVISCTPSAFGESSGFDSEIDRILAKSIPFIQPESLYQLMQSKVRLHLLDTREPREFEVSHISGAVPVGYDDLDEKKLYSLPENEPIILYCSLGSRSEKVGEKLKDKGYKQVYNLYGGIFNWVNLGYPVVDGTGKATSKVHAFNERWGKWLTRGEKVY